MGSWRRDRSFGRRRSGRLEIEEFGQEVLIDVLEEGIDVAVLESVECLVVLAVGGIFEEQIDLVVCQFVHELVEGHGIAG